MKKVMMTAIIRKYAALRNKEVNMKKSIFVVLMLLSAVSVFVLEPLKRTYYTNKPFLENGEEEKIVCIADRNVPGISDGEVWHPYLFTFFTIVGEKAKDVSSTFFMDETGRGFENKDLTVVDLKGRTQVVRMSYTYHNGKEALNVVVGGKGNVYVLEEDIVRIEAAAKDAIRQTI